MTPDELKERLLRFAVAIVRFSVTLRQRPEARQIADQMCASGTSAAVNYRAACRARSHREFVSKISVALEEADETLAWLEIVSRTQLAAAEVCRPSGRRRTNWSPSWPRPDEPRDSAPTAVRTDDARARHRPNHSLGLKIVNRQSTIQSPNRQSTIVNS